MSTIDTEAPERLVLCAMCGAPTGQFSREVRTTIGPCCENLPAPWSHGSSGEDDDYDDEHDPRPECPLCGRDTFVLTGRRWFQYEVSYSGTTSNGSLEFDADYEDLGDPVDSDNVEHVTVTCAHCGEEYHGDWDWS